MLVVVHLVATRQHVFLGYHTCVHVYIVGEGKLTAWGGGSTNHQDPSNSFPKKSQRGKHFAKTNTYKGLSNIFVV